MPYIKKYERLAFDKALKEIGPHTTTVGELNYCITVLIHEYVKAHGVSYSTMNDCIGVLDAVKMEFNRRVVVPYEDQKIEDNGDIQILKK